ncbi:DUF5605 domain-containing protein [Bulleidia sp. zg-1006]|uniref:DUF5605 domain-containing protein n=1 Tax=Bulleidia sp. zg-1006 TaxID=2806552 RepID=UPI001939633D|nr:DUF5605 domain-containing protein [Bulleidia sp. zg-1006]QRG86839.1 DUF5605 domain-containing protein [Bulleidia sp. zg-1006]
MNEENKQVLYHPVKLSVKAEQLENQWAKVLVTNKFESKILDTYYENGNYVARFLPRYEGRYNYVFQSNFGLKEHGTIDVEKGHFHGQVMVKDGQFVYQDGSYFYPFGSVVMDLLQYEEEEFRACVHELVENAVNLVSFSILADKQETLDDAYWSYLSDVIAYLEDKQIQAELVLLTEDSPSISRLDWLKIALNRLSVFTNVWWNLGNPNEAIVWTNNDFNLLAKEIVSKDQDHRLFSVISNEIMDVENSSFTHIEWDASDNYAKEIEMMKSYHKPLIVRSYGHEGGDMEAIMAQEVSRRMWDIILRGASIFADGLTLKRMPLLAIFFEQMKPVVASKVLKDTLVLKEEETTLKPTMSLRYFGYHTPAKVKLDFDKEESYQVEVMDTWNLAFSEASYHGQDEVVLPEEPYMALFIQKNKGISLLKEAYGVEDEMEEEPIQEEVVVEDYQTEQEELPSFANDFDFELPDGPVERDLIDELKDSFSLSTLDEGETESFSLTDSLQVSTDFDLVDDELPDIVTQAHDFRLDEKKEEDSLEIPSIRFYD